MDLNHRPLPYQGIAANQLSYKTLVNWVRDLNPRCAYCKQNDFVDHPFQSLRQPNLFFYHQYVNEHKNKKPDFISDIGF